MNLIQFNPDTKIRRGYDSPKHKYSSTASLYSKYGLNKYRNFLDCATLCSDHVEDFILSSIIDALLIDYSIVGVFRVYRNGTRQIYTGTVDMKWDEDIDDYAVTPNITSDVFSPPKEDIKVPDDLFAEWDSYTLYDAYGLIVELPDGTWRTVVENY